MSRIKKTFADLRKRGEAALIPFITAGDPDLGTTLKIMRALERGGADCIELGIPFSDPTADGPTIQRSSERALKRPVSLPAIFRMIRRVPRQLARAGCAFWLLQSDLLFWPGKICPPSRRRRRRRCFVRRFAAGRERRVAALDRRGGARFDFPIVADQRAGTPSLGGAQKPRLYLLRFGYRRYWRAPLNRRHRCARR